jgi:predicted transcriptional regulator
LGHTKTKVTGKEIASLLGVTQKTVSTWKNSDNNEERLKYQLIKTGLIVRKLGLREKDLQKLKELKEASEKS